MTPLIPGKHDAHNDEAEKIISIGESPIKAIDKTDNMWVATKFHQALANVFKIQLFL